MHQQLCCETPARSGSSSAASHKRHGAPRRAEQFKAGTSFRVKLGKEGDADPRDTGRAGKDSTCGRQT